MLTYILLLILSPLFNCVTKKFPSICVLTLSTTVYFVTYLFRFKFQLEISNPVLSWIWQQVILLGTSQFAYIIGMICRKDGLIGKMRACLSCENCMRKMSLWGGQILRIIVVIGLPVFAFLGHCVIQSVFVAPFTAIAVLVSLFLTELPFSSTKLYYLWESIQQTFGWCICSSTHVFLKGWSSKPNILFSSLPL